MVFCTGSVGCGIHSAHSSRPSSTQPHGHKSLKLGHEFGRMYFWWGNLGETDDLEDLSDIKMSFKEML